MSSDSYSRLRELVEGRALRLVYVIAVARSNSTLVCRMLGERLDGAVYEPAVPTSGDAAGHFVRSILRAYDHARRTRPGTVTLAVKDLALFVDDPAFAFIADCAEHSVFTFREPGAAHLSLMRQLGHEFSPLQRVDAVLRHPFEALFMALHFANLAPRLARIGRDSFPDAEAGWHRLAMAGWSLEGWRKAEAQFAKLDPARVTLLDAAQMRAAPAAATATLDRIAQNFMPEGRAPFVEIAAHSRMSPRSAWAAEARASHAIRPLGAPTHPAPVRRFEAELAARLTPIYRALLESPANPLNSLLASGLGREQMMH